MEQRQAKWRNLDYSSASDTSPCPQLLSGHSQSRGKCFLPNLHLNIISLNLLFFFPGIRRGHVTRLGEFLVQFPLPPNLSCAVIKAASLDCEDLLLPIAAMLSVENVFIRPGGKPLFPKKAFTAFHGLGVRALCVPGIGQQLFQRPQGSRNWVVSVPRLSSWKAAYA